MQNVFYIDGEWVVPAGPNNCEIINPADESHVWSFRAVQNLKLISR